MQSITDEPDYDRCLLIDLFSRGDSLLGSRWGNPIIQQFVINYLIRPNLRKRVAEECKNNPPKRLVTAWKKMSHQLRLHKSNTNQKKQPQWENNAIESSTNY